MSYAAVAAHNAPPASEQPHPDPALWTTEQPYLAAIADDTAKVNVVAADFKSKPATTTSVQDVPAESAPVPISGGIPSHTTSSSAEPSKRTKGQDAAAKAKRYVHEVEEEGSHLWDVTKRYLLRPGVAGGLLGVVKLGLLSVATYSLVKKPYLRQDTRFIASAAAAAFALFSVEGYAAEKYRATPVGKEEERRAKDERAALYRTAREHILRPGVLGGLLGLLNTAIIGTVGYYGYKHWDSPRWDRRLVSAISAGMFTLWTGEGYLAEQHRQRHH